ncbi:MAG: molybdopterin-dependent oxidoreductase [Desulfobacterales bacterium]|nr:MAG: molybdopterin-dependent oxidoreductase [Desulfobacterales bacterium]
MKTITACTLDCPDACSVVVDAATPSRVRVSGNPDHPFTDGFTCAKIKRYPQRLAHPERITAPLRRDGSGWRQMEWDEALDLCALQIQSLRSRPEAMLPICGSGDMGVLKYAGHFLFASLGAAQAIGSLCCSAGEAACQADFGAADHNDIRDLHRARRIVLWGRDVHRCSIHTARLVRQAKRAGARILAITAGGDANAGLADEVISVRPGSDRFLAAAVLRLLMERDLVPPETSAQASGWQDFRKLVLGQAPLELARNCGLATPAIETVLSFYTAAEPAATLVGWGLQRHRFGGQNVRFINALAFAAGHIGVAGGGSHYFLPPGRHLNLGWALPPSPPERKPFYKPTIGAELRAADPPVELIWIHGTNLVNQTPDLDACARTLRQAKMTVVVDAFMTDTARCADLILPCALVLEKEDIVASYLHDYINYCRPALEPPGQARTDHWIFRELGRRLDPAVDIPSAPDCLSASLDSRFLQVDLPALRRNNWTLADRPPVAFAGGVFAHPDRRYHPPDRLDPEPLPPPGYPLRLLTLIHRGAMHSQLLPEAHGPEPIIRIDPSNPCLAGLDRDRPVWLASPLGRLRVTLSLAEGLGPEIAIGRRGGWACAGHGYNRIITAGRTDMGDGAPFYQQYVRLEN